MSEDYLTAVPSKQSASSKAGGTAKKPFWAKCEPCGHIWPCAYLPMDMKDSAKLMKKLHCPMCGADAKRITPAKQNDGVLNEVAARTLTASPDPQINPDVGPTGQINPDVVVPVFSVMGDS